MLKREQQERTSCLAGGSLTAWTLAGQTSYAIKKMATFMDVLPQCLEYRKF
jgi:hypothetical protein